MQITESYKVAIETKYLGPTNFRGSRVKAFTRDLSVTIEWDDALNIADNHMAAIKALCEKQDWNWNMTLGETGRGYVAVFTNERSES